MKNLQKEMKKQVQGKNIDEIVRYRDKFDLNSKEWEVLNEIKANLLEENKPSTKENIIYFDKNDLIDIPEGFSLTNSLSEIPFKVGRRSLLEYNPKQRHPIPYCIVRNKKKYFFILRESGSGEIRLIGKKGLLGGHVAEEDVDTLSLNESIVNGLRRELKEEAGITNEMVQNISIKGLIKSNEGVDSDHLGVVYEIVLNTDEIKSEEEENLTGIWIQENEIRNHYESLESWSKIIYDNLLK